jgi:hypothetical protein
MEEATKETWRKTENVKNDRQWNKQQQQQQ